MKLSIKTTISRSFRSQQHKIPEILWSHFHNWSMAWALALFQINYILILSKQKMIRFVIKSDDNNSQSSLDLNKTLIYWKYLNLKLIVFKLWSWTKKGLLTLQRNNLLPPRPKHLISLFNITNWRFKFFISKMYNYFDNFVLKFTWIIIISQNKIFGLLSPYRLQS